MYEGKLYGGRLLAGAFRADFLVCAMTLCVRSLLRRCSNGLLLAWLGETLPSLSLFEHLPVWNSDSAARMQRSVHRAGRHHSDYFYRVDELTGAALCTYSTVVQIEDPPAGPWASAWVVMAAPIR